MKLWNLRRKHVHFLKCSVKLRNQTFATWSKPASVKGFVFFFLNSSHSECCKMFEHRHWFVVYCVFCPCCFHYVCFITLLPSAPREIQWRYTKDFEPYVFFQKKRHTPQFTTQNASLLHNDPMRNTPLFHKLIETTKLHHLTPLSNLDIGQSISERSNRRSPLAKAYGTRIVWCTCIEVTHLCSCLPKLPVWKTHRCHARGLNFRPVEPCHLLRLLRVTLVARTTHLRQTSSSAMAPRTVERGLHGYNVRNHLAAISEFFMNSVVIDFFRLDLQLNVCQSLHHPVRGTRFRCTCSTSCSTRVTWSS